MPAHRFGHRNLLRIQLTLLALTLGCLVRAAETPPAPAPAAVIEHYGLEEGATPVKERAGWRKPKRILVGGFIPKIAEQLQASAPGVEFVVVNSPAEAAKKAANVDAVIGLCTPDILAAGKSIRWIQLVTAGVENCVAIPAVRERDILVTNMQRIGGPIIAEHVMAMTLAFTRGLDLYIPAQASGEWRRITPPGRMQVVAGKTMLVVGLGGI